jgi:ribosomal protein L16 Arg81 hydroxylase
VDRYELLFGQAGSFSPILHFDTLGLHAFILQIYGRKTVYLAPAFETANLYQNPRTPNLSLVPINGDLTEYPLVERVKAYRADLGPGDLLFIPAGWWHGAVNPVISIAVTINSINNTNWTRFSREWTRKRNLTGSKRAIARLILAACGALRRAR